MNYLKYIGIGVVVLFVGAVLYLTYNAGYNKAEAKAQLEFTEFKLKSEQEYTVLLKEKINRGIELNAKINSIDTQRINQISELKNSYEKTINDMRNSFKPSGVRKCPASKDAGKGKVNSASELICYTRAELYGRIKKSLAIGARADKLANDYNALLKIVEVYNEQ